MTVTMTNEEIVKRICKTNGIEYTPYEYGSEAYWFLDQLNNLEDLDDLFENYVLPTEDEELIKELIHFMYDENTWFDNEKEVIESYISYVLKWLKDHRESNMSPCCLDEYYDNEYQEEVK